MEIFGVKLVCLALGLIALSAEEVQSTDADVMKGSPEYNVLIGQNNFSVDPLPITNFSSWTNQTDISHHHDGIHLVGVNFEHVRGPLIFCIVVIIAALSKIGFHHANFLSSKVPESCMLIILGLLCGALIYVCGPGNELHFFKPDLFFLFLLPPIVLEAAFSLHDRTFTDNLGSILLFSVLGTVIACFAIGLTLFGLVKAGAMVDPGASLVQILTFTSLIVAVDPVAVLAIFQEVGVNNMLYFLIFGESLLNDGVTVVLYNVMQSYNRMEVIEADQIILGIIKFFIVVLGGLFIGFVCGLIASFITKFTDSVKVAEPIIIFGFAYLSYILAEMFHFSGIISIIGCGLIEMQYAFNNLTNKSKLACKFFAKVMSNLSEITIFLFLGLEVVHPGHVWNTGFVLWSTLLCVVYRFCITFGLSLLINKCDKYRVRMISIDEMFLISYGGLRGAVCFSLVALLDNKEFAMKELFVSTTLFVIFFTVFFQGGTIKWLVKKLQVSLQEDPTEMILYQELNQHIQDHLMAGIEEIIGVSGKHHFREQFERLDQDYIRPVLLRDPKRCDVDEINQYYEKLVMKEHYKNLRLCGASNLPRVGSSLRQVDSASCLKILGNDLDVDEQRQLEKEEELKDKKRQKSQETARSLDLDAGSLWGKVLRHALAISKNQTTCWYHDKNYIGDEKRAFVGNLRQKYKKNLLLSGIQPKGTLERAHSWNENQGDQVKRRTSDVHLNFHASVRSHTVDLSDESEPMTPIFTLNGEEKMFDTVPEEERNLQTIPLLSNQKNMNYGGQRVIVQEERSPSNKSENQRVQFDVQNVKLGNKLDFEKPATEVHKGNVEKSVDIPNVKSIQSLSLHSGHLLRQDAIKDSEFQLGESDVNIPSKVSDSDIPLLEMSINKDSGTRKRSV